jgi:hypothetical protein
MHRTFLRLLASTTLGLALLTSASAQDSPADPSVPSERCRVDPREPDSGGATGEAQPAPSQPAEPDTGSDESLSGTLDPCNGVLVPPRVGDGEITEPPPDAGTTPIIRPEDLPAQQPAQ